MTSKCNACTNSCKAENVVTCKDYQWDSLRNYPFQKLCSSCRYCETKDRTHIDSTTWCNYLKTILHDAFKPISCHDITEDHECRYKISRHDKTRQLKLIL